MKKVKLKRPSGILGTILQIKRQLKKNGICNIHARFTSLSNLMLVFRGKSTEQQNFSFIFIPIWPTSKLQAVYFFLKCLRVFT